MVAGGRFELPVQGSEPCVLPLHHPAIFVTQIDLSCELPGVKTVLRCHETVIPINEHLKTMLTDDPIVLRIRSDGALLDHLLKLVKAVHLDAGIDRITGLIDHIPLAALFVILHARRGVDADPLRVIDKITPVVRHRPAPFVGVLGGHDVAQIIQQHTGKGFAHWLLKLAELDRAIVAELKLDTDPVLVRFAALRSLIVDADQHLALRAADLDRGAFRTDKNLPIVRLADVHTTLRVGGNAIDIQYAGMIVISDVQTGDFE